MRRPRAGLIALAFLVSTASGSAGQENAALRFGFDGELSSGSGAAATVNGAVAFTRGLVGESLRLSGGDSASVALADSARVAADRDFSVSFWIRTVAPADARMMVLSTKAVPDNSLGSQKQPGWAFYVSNGTWAWNAGSGDRRLTYERDNGARMPMNDGRWHQLAMTYSSAARQVRLYYDGRERAVYNVADADGFDFSGPGPLAVGWEGHRQSADAGIIPAMHQGRDCLQALVDEFNSFGLGAVADDELVRLVVDPEGFLESKLEAAAEPLDPPRIRAARESVDSGRLAEIEAALMDNPYTIHQAFSFMEAAPAMKIFSLQDGQIGIDRMAAGRYAERERLAPADFDIDELAVDDRVLTTEEVRSAYTDHFELPAIADREVADSITSGVWNIFHGGIHFTTDEHGWDSRDVVAQILSREGVDVVMMQETYSHGDYIAAELGYYFATTLDRDYLNQGSNISVLSRYPIVDLFVEGESAFSNIGVKVQVSRTQQVYVMSNWYGMTRFADVFDFHQGRFSESDRTPVLFGGDFNAVPHTDGGDSPASVVLENAGFADAFRETHPDVGRYPGYTHRSGSRIDQLFYKGIGLVHTSTRLVSEWPTGFPSDHYLIVSEFELH